MNGQTKNLWFVGANVNWGYKMNDFYEARVEKAEKAFLIADSYSHFGKTAARMEPGVRTIRRRP